MKHQRTSYRNENWFEFSEKVQKRDGYKCLRCGRKKGDVILQTHHKIYTPGIELWECALSDCISLCKGCHSQEHGITEPSRGWTLISIDDLGGPFGYCERNGCGNDIRYEHEIYHPKFGYKIVGSSCVEVLTNEDQYLSAEVIKVFDKISDFVNNSTWESSKTSFGTKYIFSKHLHHKIQIYGNEKSYSFKIAIKEPGVNYFQYKNLIKAHNKTLDQVKELGFIVLKGTISKDRNEIEILRNIYKTIR